MTLQNQMLMEPVARPQQAIMQAIDQLSCVNDETNWDVAQFARMIPADQSPPVRVIMTYCQSFLVPINVPKMSLAFPLDIIYLHESIGGMNRSEERRVGKECSS